MLYNQAVICQTQMSEDWGIAKLLASSRHVPQILIKKKIVPFPLFSPPMLCFLVSICKMYCFRNWCFSFSSSLLSVFSFVCHYSTFKEIFFLCANSKFFTVLSSSYFACFTRQRKLMLPGSGDSQSYQLLHLAGERYRYPTLNLQPFYNNRTTRQFQRFLDFLMIKVFQFYRNTIAHLFKRVLTINVRKQTFLSIWESTWSC